MPCHLHGTHRQAGRGTPRRLRQSIRGGVFVQTSRSGRGSFYAFAHRRNAGWRAGDVPSSYRRPVSISYLEARPLYCTCPSPYLKDRIGPSGVTALGNLRLSTLGPGFPVSRRRPLPAHWLTGDITPKFPPSLMAKLDHARGRTDLHGWRPGQTQGTQGPRGPNANGWVWMCTT